MKYPILLIIPAMFLADYYLTLLGQILYRRNYGNHLKIPQYELNPAWQNDINQIKWFNRRFLLIAFLFSGIVIVIGQVVDGALAEALKLPLGMLVTFYAIIIGRHLTNIFIFRYAYQNPGAISGEARLTQEMALKISQYSAFVVLLPLLIVTFANPAPFTIGSLVGVIGFGLIHFGWLRQQKAKSRRVLEAQQNDLAQH